MSPTYYAHSGQARDFSDWQLLAEHLREVGRVARALASSASPGNRELAEAAYAAGLVHDLGKFRPEFQNYIKGLLAKGNPLTYHKQAGAAQAFFTWRHTPISFAVMGHHGGIPDKSSLKIDLKQDAGEPTARAVWQQAVSDCSELAALVPTMPTFTDELHADLFTRMLFSCLVDADWSDTGRHARKCKALPEEPAPPTLNPLERLSMVRAQIAARSKACKEEHIRSIRASILNACLVKADESPGLFSLTVPTGGGKTLAGLAFALKHAGKHSLRRVIYVAPYMSILEQNVGVFRDALGLTPDADELFEHYSLAEPPGDESAEETARESAARRAENWDSPFVVTTNVQFFESLFSNKPGRCRKLHNVARSVVILDECQTLPPGLVAPTCGMLKQLAAECGATIVLCTATQPAFNHEKLGPDRLEAREIIPADLDLFGQLKRVHVSWPKADEQALTWGAVAERMRNEPSALCVVNTKKAAKAIYEELKSRGTPGLYHLSTAMCPAHRREKLNAIRQRLKDGQPCFVVSTQLVEAGVDVDFPFLMRELAPLESIIQAAGRCNREGRIVEGGRIVVFRSAAAMQEPKKYFPPDAWYKAGRETLETHFLAQGVMPQIDDPRTIQEYFERLYYSGNLDGQGVQAMRQKYQFKQVSEAYRVIDNAGEPVVVRWVPYAAEIEALLTELRTRPRRALFRALTRFQVNLFPHQVLRAAHLIQKEPSGVLVWAGRYDGEVGIVEEMADAFIV